MVESPPVNLHWNCNDILELVHTFGTSVCCCETCWPSGKYELSRLTKKTTANIAPFHTIVICKRRKGGDGYIYKYLLIPACTVTTVSQAGDRGRVTSNSFLRAPEARAVESVAWHVFPSLVRSWLRLSIYLLAHLSTIVVSRLEVQCQWMKNCRRKCERSPVSLSIRRLGITPETWVAGFEHRMLGWEWPVLSNGDNASMFLHFVRHVFRSCRDNS